MKFFKFEMNTTVFLMAVIFTILAWIGFEFYHRTTDRSIDPALKAQADRPLTGSFDEETLKKLYENREKFYEIQTTPTPTR